MIVMHRLIGCEDFNVQVDIIIAMIVMHRLIGCDDDNDSNADGGNISVDFKLFIWPNCLGMIFKNLKLNITTLALHNKFT